MTFTIYAIYVAALSLVAFFVYFADKKKAQKGEWRIPEATLLTLCFLGGGCGGYLAMFLARHKTRKWYFHFVHFIGILWQAALFVFLLFHPDILF